MEKKLEIRNRYGFVPATADELLAKIKNHSAAGLRWCFIFNGKPYTTAKEFDLDDDGIKILFKAEINSLVYNFIYRFWQDAEKRTACVNKEEIAGYEIVDVYEGRKYVGSYMEIVVK